MEGRLCTHRGGLPAAGVHRQAIRQQQLCCNQTAILHRKQRRGQHQRPQASSSDANPELPANLPTFFDSTPSDAAPTDAARSDTAEPLQQRPSGSSPEPAKQPSQAGGLKALLNPLSDPACNARLVALCSAQALCSVATLIHDTYVRSAPLQACGPWLKQCSLAAVTTQQTCTSCAADFAAHKLTYSTGLQLPLYLQDVLGLSNTKVRPAICGRLVLCGGLATSQPCSICARLLAWMPCMQCRKL